ncbi:hypothetical protein AB6C47_018240 [Vibrio cyclitrophicus]
MMEEHAAYIISMVGKDELELVKASRHADKVYRIVKGAYDKHNTPEVRQELESKYIKDIKANYNNDVSKKLKVNPNKTVNRTKQRL